MKTPVPSLTVVMPALNSARWLPAHLASMQPWLELAEEIIVVDSASTDDTVALIQAGIQHPGLRVLQHPRGLYQSWNFGLQQVRTKYVYISTVGDAMTRAGLEHMLAVAEKLACDVVMSKPRSITYDDQPLDDAGYWPIVDLLDTLDVTAPRRVTGLELMIFALLHIPSGILGSSASNLYRAEVLQRSPFPTGYGTTGDAAWVISQAFAYQFAVTPEIFSTFRHHPKAYSAKEYEVLDLSERLFQLACATLDQQPGVAGSTAASPSQLDLNQLLTAAREEAEWRVRLDAQRQRKLPWIFNPAAWHARAKRDATRRAVHAHKQTLRARLKEQ